MPHSKSKNVVGKGSGNKRGSITKDKVFLVATAVVIVLMVILFYFVVFGNNIQKSNTTSPPPQQFQSISKLKNLTSEYLYNKTSKASKVVIVNNPVSANVTINSTSLQVGKAFSVKILFNGTFDFTQNTTAYVRNIINIEYVGFYNNGADDMLVYNNRPNVTDYFTLATQAHEYAPPNADAFNTTAIEFNLTPTSNTMGETWYFCGGEFITYENQTDRGAIFNNVTFNRLNVDNSTVINLISKQCVSRSVG